MIAIVTRRLTRLNAGRRFDAFMLWIVEWLIAVLRNQVDVPISFEIAACGCTKLRPNNRVVVVLRRIEKHDPGIAPFIE
jgi:hypothetical protein